ncbi:protein of unknown function [Pararobbsia alpina]
MPTCVAVSSGARMSTREFTVLARETARLRVDGLFGGSSISNALRLKVNPVVNCLTTGLSQIYLSANGQTTGPLTEVYLSLHGFLQVVTHSFVHR